jgi:hypothetical protein
MREFYYQKPRGTIIELGARDPSDEPRGEIAEFATCHPNKKGGDLLITALLRLLASPAKLRRASPI